MAEGLARNLGRGRVEAFSAGTVPKPIHPLAIRVMADSGIDISEQESKSLDVYRDQQFDYIITVCDRARRSCPVWPGPHERIDWSFDDPAEATGTESEKAEVFRHVMLEIKKRIDLFLLATLR
jgi:arsenate reductase